MYATILKPVGWRITRTAVVAWLDASAAAASFVLALNLRMGGDIPDSMTRHLPSSLLIIAVVSTGVFALAGMYRRIWRFVSVTDLAHVAMVALVATAAAMLALSLLGRGAVIPHSVPMIHWFVLVVMLGTLRVLRRATGEQVRAVRSRLPGRELLVANDRQPVAQHRALVVGSAEDVAPILMMIHAHSASGYRAVGVLDPIGQDVSRVVRGVRILGSTDAIEVVVKQLEAQGRRPTCLILADSTAGLTGDARVHLVTLAESLGLIVARMPRPAQFDDVRAAGLELAPVNLADLLGRTQTTLDTGAIARSVQGRRVMVTGAGGTIGSELVRQLASFGPAELVLLDNGEFNLYSIDLEMRENYPSIPRTAVLCSIRQRTALFRAFEQHRPELVFHAAALKHVPLVEQNPCDGVQTNVLGTQNVCDAAQKFGCIAMVQVSTDKAVNPVGMMGATKRLGELYCQALDLAGCDDEGSTRFLTVRFGNVLGSSGSLIPLFQRQLSRRGPLTVTHPEIRRFFMTVHEAVQLILQGTARALEGDARRGRIFVLDMGEAIKIVDIARRMIELAGLVPDRDIKIEIVGLRPGEKLYEELFDEHEHRLPSALPGIFEAEPAAIPLAVLQRSYERLADAARAGDSEAARAIIMDIIARGHVTVEALDDELELSLATGT